jgi:hypothetical protein
METAGVTSAQIQEFVDNHPEAFFCIGMIVPVRPGVRLCMVRMEHENYPPDSPLNDKFHMFIIQWMDAVWAMMGFPKEDLDKLAVIATECGVKPVHATPVAISAEGVSHFPIQGDRLFYFENLANHPVYKNDSETLGDVLSGEDIAIEETFQKTKLRH